MKRLFCIALLYIINLPMNAFASDITASVSVIGNGKPILTVKTNLPPKSVLMASLANPINLGGDGYFALEKGEVTANQTVQFGPFTKNGDRLSSGTYQVKISTVMASLQPEEARSFFGMHGERLTGPLVSSLPGTTEKYFSTNSQFTIKSENSISTGPSDEHTIGSLDEKWQRVQIKGPELYVQTNGHYFTTNPPLSTIEHHSGYGFVTNIVSNLPESTIVGAPQSAMHMVEGNCETRHYSVLGSVLFAGKNRSGIAMESTPADNLERKLAPNSPIEKAFDVLCAIAREQK